MPQKVADPEAANLGFVLSVLRNCETIKPDWGEVAKENGISYGKNAQAKFKTMLDKHGYRLEGNRVVLSDPNTTPPPSKLSRIQTTPKTPKSASATKRKDTTNGSADDPTPTKKKKKAAPKSEALVVEEKPDNTESDSVVKDEAT